MDVFEPYASMLQVTIDTATPSNKASEEAVSQPHPPDIEKVKEKPMPKVDTTPITEKPNPAYPPPPTTSALEPQLVI